MKIFFFWWVAQGEEEWQGEYCWESWEAIFFQFWTMIWVAALEIESFTDWSIREGRLFLDNPN